MTLRINTPTRASALAAIFLLLCSGIVRAQSTNNFQEDFTGASTNNQWYFYNGACLTAGTGTSTTSPGYVPGCATIFNTYYSQPNAVTKKIADKYLVGGFAGYLGSSTAPATAPGIADPVKNGALRFTNGYPYGYNENGAIVSNFTFPTDQGLQITFKTVTYLGDSGGSGKDGADGMSFFLMDGAVTPNIGSFGGSLAYTCSINNPDYHGLIGGYLGLGIDEYGNFLNGAYNSITGAAVSGPDNTASGFGYVPNRIGLRGAGSINWTWLSTTTPYSQYLSGTAYSNNTTNQKNMVMNTCRNGYLTDYNGNAIKDSSKNTIPVMDYPAITTKNNGATVGAYAILPVKIANESATTRGDTTQVNNSPSNATPITYKLKITQDGLLSFSYSYNGGAWSSVLTSQSITASNGALPGSFAFGFAGSTGGSTNVHEIMCFKAGPIEAASTSGSVGVYQNPTVKTGVQLFLANYFPSSSSGQLTATDVTFDTTLKTLVLASKPTWDASCVLTGVTKATGACSTGVTSLTAQDWKAARTMLTWNGTSGIPFESGTGGLTAAQLANLNLGDTTSTANRLDFLRGDRTNEIDHTTNPNGLYRQRTSVLGDIVDSSPLWVGPAQTYDPTVSWTDLLYPSKTAPEASASIQSYASFQAAEQGRLNVVYAGANDGFLHGFRAGTTDSTGTLQTTYNDGQEVLAYMPGAILQSAASACTAGTTESVAQNIHGVLPANSNCSTPTTSASVDNTLDFSNTNYAHNWFVDAAPGSGDLFYNGAWHTWLVGGLGPGGAVIYALDITNPSSAINAADKTSPTFTESNASKIVIGEWSPSNIVCPGFANCANYLGNTYGTPLIRRFHNGSWGVVFGNGYGSSNNTTPGVFIMLIDPTSGSPTFYFLSTPAPTGKTPPANGIASVASADLDLDHIVDYLYAGDLLGNIWRFDVTSSDPTQWAVSASSPLFNAGQPITTKLTVSTFRWLTTTQNLTGITLTHDPERVVVNFGTGRAIAQTTVGATQYASGSQYLFGIWDWDMGDPKKGTGWNGLSSQQGIGLTAPQTISLSTNLQQQTVSTFPGSGSNPAFRTVSANAVCWKSAPTGCSGNSMGWYIQLPTTNEQVIFDPTLTTDGKLVVNTFIPSVDSPLSCNAAGNSTGFTFALWPDTGAGGGSSSGGFFNVIGNSGAQTADAVQLNGVGIPQTISSGQKADSNSAYLLTQTSGGGATTQKVNRSVLATGARLNWIERR
jgi:type IV pilus assembly protein PilY1